MTNNSSEGCQHTWSFIGEISRLQNGAFGLEDSNSSPRAKYTSVVQW